MTPALQKAIAGLYEAFSCESKPTVIDGCDCCITENEIGVLLSKSLRSLTPDDLGRYAQSVFLTVGSEADFKYFLPRILEILATEDGWWPSSEIVGKAISKSWSCFSVAQQNSLLSFFTEILISLIESKNGSAIDGWICGIARGVPDLQPYLNLIEKNPSALVAFYEENSEPLSKGRLGNSFWDKESPNEKILLDWFQSGRIKELISTTYGLE